MLLFFCIEIREKFYKSLEVFDDKMFCAWEYNHFVILKPTIICYNSLKPAGNIICYRETARIEKEVLL